MEKHLFFMSETAPAPRRPAIQSHSMPRTLALIALLLAAIQPLSAADHAVTLERTATGGVSVSVDGKPFAGYVIDQANKPYLWPVHGPTGRQMTRAYPMRDVPEETPQQRDHVHHRGITFGSESIGLVPWPTEAKRDPLTGDETSNGGGDTWHERATFEALPNKPETAASVKRRMSALASIRHREFTELRSDGDRAVIAETLDHVDHAGKRFLSEERRLTFHVVGRMWAIDFDQDFVASDGAVVFADRKDAGLFIRVPSSMAVDSRLGGRIFNSSGLVDADAWSKPADWVDYHGPVGGEQLGVAILNHPSSFRHPTRWHVRTYGLFAANPFASRTYDPSLPSVDHELKPGDRLKLRHRILFHEGDEKAAKIAEAYEAYAK
jgi:hypothetical protein